MADDLHLQFDLAQLNTLYRQAGNDAGMRARIDKARRARGFDPGVPAVGLPGVIERVEQPSRENGGRFITRYESDNTGRADMLAWLAPDGAPGSMGAKVKLDAEFLNDAKRGGRLEQVFVPHGKTAAAV